MANEPVRAPALGGVTERLDAQYDDAHGADDDGVRLPTVEVTYVHRRVQPRQALIQTSHSKPFWI